MRKYLVIGLAVALVAASVLVVHGLGAQTADAASPCQFQKSSSTVAFCDTFDQSAAPNSSRSGALDPTVWGVSYISSLDNPSQGSEDQFDPAAAPAACGGGTVLPPKNVEICHGQLFDSVNDGGGQTVLAMYPRQPFDIAGRTGDVTFDVANDTKGSHTFWPTFVYTDQPVPAPYEGAAAINSYARNSFGFNMDASVEGCGSASTWTVGEMWETVDYVLHSVDFSKDGCVGESSDPTVQSHVEVQISPGGVTVWASNPGSSTLVKIANASLTMPLTRGLVWMEDSHYNGNKTCSGCSDNTFGWDNFGFDGPVLPRDRGFDVPMNTAAGRGPGSENTGWAGTPTLKTLPVDATSLANAKSALVEFNWFPYRQAVPTISVNGHASISTPWVFGDSVTYSWRTIAVPVPLGEVVQGQNSIAVENSLGGSVANFDLILVGAGGVPTCLDPSNCSTVSSSAPTPTPRTPTPTPLPSPKPEQINDAPCTVHGVAGHCTGTFIPD